MKPAGGRKLAVAGSALVMAALVGLPLHLLFTPLLWLALPLAGIGLMVGGKQAAGRALLVTVGLACLVLFFPPFSASLRAAIVGVAPTSGFGKVLAVSGVVFVLGFVLLVIARIVSLPRKEQRPVRPSLRSPVPLLEPERNEEPPEASPRQPAHGDDLGLFR